MDGIGYQCVLPAQVTRALCLGPLAMLGLCWSVAASIVALVGDGATAALNAATAVGRSLMALAPAGRAATTVTSEVGPPVLSILFLAQWGRAAALLTRAPRSRRDGGPLFGWTPP